MSERDTVIKAVLHLVWVEYNASRTYDADELDHANDMLDEALVRYVTAARPPTAVIQVAEAMSEVDIEALAAKLREALSGDGP